MTLIGIILCAWRIMWPVKCPLFMWGLKQKAWTKRERWKLLPPLLPTEVWVIVKPVVLNIVVYHTPVLVWCISCSSTNCGPGNFKDSFWWVSFCLVRMCGKPFKLVISPIFSEKGVMIWSLITQIVKWKQ